MGIRTVAVYVEADSEAPFVREADEAVRLPGGYLDGDSILKAARATGAGAIHPGYGYLSENAGFAREVTSAGLCWVGPSPEVIEQMGDKITAKALAEASGVPTLPGSEDVGEAEAVGFPLLVKASAGGGGKGMRIVESASDLDEAVASARREAASGFGDDRVFLERYVTRARHIEIQILGDSHGKVIHLGERECSIQRRHQKIIEESPSPRVDDALRATMGEAAVSLAASLGYESAGTVEFLVDDETGEFFFLEVNTRLQVEHPVTECVTGVDLVREQLKIAAGEPLEYEQSDISWTGSSIEARLYAEDPDNDFLPATGKLVGYEPAAAPELRWDSGVERGSVVGTDFDPMLAKVIAYGPTREEAAGRLALGLERSHLAGVVTNRDFLVETLRSSEFLAGDTTTDFIGRVAPARKPVREEAELERMARMAALWIQGENREAASVWKEFRSGWLSGRMPHQEATLRLDGESRRIQYQSTRDGRFQFAGGDLARIHGWTPDGLDAEIDGHRCRVRITQDGDKLYLHGPRGDFSFVVEPRFILPGTEETAGGFVASMPGKVIELRVQVGDRVEAEDTVLILEAMKMEHPVRATEAGVVSEVLVGEGDQVEAGALLLVVEEAEA